jgi:hypothetical protein
MFISISIQVLTRTIFSVPNYLDFYNRGVVLKYANKNITISPRHIRPNNAFTWSLPFVGAKSMFLF